MSEEKAVLTLLSKFKELSDAITMFEDPMMELIKAFENHKEQLESVQRAGKDGLRIMTKHPELKIKLISKLSFKLDELQQSIGQEIGAISESLESLKTSHDKLKEKSEFSDSNSDQVSSKLLLLENRKSTKRCSILAQVRYLDEVRTLLDSYVQGLKVAISKLHLKSVNKDENDDDVHSALRLPNSSRVRLNHIWLESGFCVE